MKISNTGLALAIAGIVVIGIIAMKKNKKILQAAIKPLPATTATNQTSPVSTSTSSSNTPANTTQPVNTSVSPADVFVYGGNTATTTASSNTTPTNTTIIQPGNFTNNTVPVYVPPVHLYETYEQPAGTQQPEDLEILLGTDTGSGIRNF